MRMTSGRIAESSLGPLRARAVTAQRLRSPLMRLITAGFSAFRPFRRIWVFLFAVALFLTFGFGGGTPNSATWLTIKFLVLGVLLTSLLVELASQVRDWVVRTK
jgi:hypothetical protein